MPRYIFAISARILNQRQQSLFLNYISKRTLPLFPPKKKDDEESPGIKTKELVRIREFFDKEGVKTNYDKKHFIDTVEDFKKIKKIKRFGYSEFIVAALPAMKEFGVHKDIESYKALMRVFPKGAFIPSSKLASGFYPYYVQQQTAIKILIQMEENNIIPDREMETQIIETFSKFSLVWQRCARMIYWMTKFRNANPFPFPEKIPDDPLQLAIIALQRMMIYIDPQTEIYVYRTTQIDESAEDTWICFAQSDSQCKLIEDLDLEKYRVSIDGPFNVWVKENSISYFVLYARELRPKENRDLVEEFLIAEQQNNDVSDIALTNFGSFDFKEAVDPIRKEHKQDDGIILAILATGTSSQQSLMVSLCKLEQHNPRLHSVPIVVSFDNPHQEQSTNSSNDLKKNFDYQLHFKKHQNVNQSKTSDNEASNQTDHNMGNNSKF